MCKLEPEGFLRVRHISPLLLPPSLGPLFLSVLPFLPFECLKSILAVDVRPSEQHFFFFFARRLCEPTHFFAFSTFSSLAGPPMLALFLSMPGPGAEVCSQLRDRWCERLWMVFMSCCENSFNVVPKHRGYNTRACDVECCANMSFLVNLLCDIYFFFIF